LLLIPVLIGVSIIVFTLTRITGDPAAGYINEKMTPSQIEQVYEKYHFNEPIIDQYGYWLKGILELDWGWSKTAARPVTDAIAYYFPATLELTLVSIIFAIFIGIYLGIRSAVRRNKPFDHATRVISLLGVSLPVFWLALILQFVFYSELHWFPLNGRASYVYFLSGSIPDITGLYLVDSLLVGNFSLFKDSLWHIVLPALTLSFGTIAVVTRIMRNSMLEVLSLDYIKTARAKGLNERSIIWKHARKNAMIPTTTVIGLSFGGLLGGAVLTESIFGWPGLGRWSATSIKLFDYNSVLGFCLMVAVIYVLINLVVDVMYAYLDPRVHLE
jgi:peptide/nickel transport system permease protein